MGGAVASRPYAYTDSEPHTPRAHTSASARRGRQSPEHASPGKAAHTAGTAAGGVVGGRVAKANGNAPVKWANRIVGEGLEDADQLLANPFNWRVHPKSQQTALEAALDGIGWIQRVIVNRQTGHVIDGHLRASLAISRGEQVPVLYVDLNEDEERLALATIDPLSAMAAADRDMLADLLEGLRETPLVQDDAALRALLGQVAGENGIGFEGDVVPDPGAVVFSNEQIIGAAFDYFRRTGFPYRKLPVHVCMQEINNLALTEYDNLTRSSVGYHVADTYHPHRFHASADGMKSPFDAFQDDKLLNRAMNLALSNDYTLPGEAWGQLWIVSGVQMCSNFRPGFALYLYRRFCSAGDIVLDTSTGYGGRLVGFMASLCSKYIGIDPNVPTHEGNLRMAADLGFADKVELYNLPAEDVPHDVVAERCDFAFTSPPYFAKEHYSEDDTQSWVRYKTGESWRDGFLAKMLALQFAALKPGKYAIVNIADVTVRNKTYPLEAWTVEAGIATGFEHIRTERYELTHRFGAGMDDEVATEPVIVFRKPGAN